MREYKAYLDQLWKEKVTVAFATGISIFAALMFATRAYFEGVDHPSLYMLLVFALIFFFAAQYVKRSHNYRLLAYIMGFCSIIILPIRAGATGGFSSSVLTWFALVPLVAVILIGIRAGIFLTLLTILHFIAIVIFKPPFYSIHEVHVTFSTHLLVLVIGLSLTSVLAILYETNREALNNLLINSYQKLEESAALKLRNEQLETAQSMVRTYNHEINNPLQIALGNLHLYRRKGDEKSLQKLEESLERIAEITKKIGSEVRDGQFNFDANTSLTGNHSHE